ncbi:hypothetical protein D2Q93_08500 [Alicyclobacillaceae bacterium I2511]|nr:hypothetical protein D2Q93_08500 [Alicyclobacillaceae bacterium I2511]
MDWRDGGALLLAVGLLWILFRSLFWHRRGNQQVPLKGKFKATREWLDGNGYQVLRVRERAEWAGYYDDRQFQKTLIADFIVRQGTHSYVVKIASERDKGINGVKLRDQWYPLVIAFGVHGVLHIDVDGERVHVIDFELKQPGYARRKRWIQHGTWLVMGILLAFVLSHGR